MELLFRRHLRVRRRWIYLSAVEYIYSLVARETRHFSITCCLMQLENTIAGSLLAISRAAQSSRDKIIANSRAEFYLARSEEKSTIFRASNLSIDTLRVSVFIFDTLVCCIGNTRFVTAKRAVELHLFRRLLSAGEHRRAGVKSSRAPAGYEAEERAKAQLLGKFALAEAAR